MRLVSILAFSFSAGVALILGALKINPTSVILNIVASEVQLELSSDWKINDFAASRIKVGHTKGVSLNVAKMEQSHGSSAGDGFEWDKLPTVGPIRLNPSPGIRAWSLSVSSAGLGLRLNISQGSTVSVSIPPETREQINLRTTGSRVEGRLDVEDVFLLSCNHCVLQQDEDSQIKVGGGLYRVESLNRELAFEGEQDTLFLSIYKPNDNGRNAREPLARNLSLRSIQFVKLVGDDLESTVVAPGVVTFPGLNRRAGTIKEGDFVLLTAERGIRLRKLAVADHLELEIEAEADELLTGISGAMSSLRPSILAWIYQSQWFQLVIGAILTGTTTIMAVLYRLGLLPTIGRNRDNVSR